MQIWIESLGLDAQVALGGVFDAHATAETRSREREVAAQLRAQIGSSFTRWSQAHSHGVCVVIGRPKDAIGIDLEWASRPLAEGLKKRITLDHEKRFEIDTLQLWCVKEAAFKGFSGEPEGLVISTLELQSWDPKLCQGVIRNLKSPQETLQVACQPLHHGGQSWCVAIAWKSPS